MTEVTEAAEFPRWRRWTAGALIVISCVLVPLSVLAVWVRGQVLNTDRYVANITPLASNPAVIDTAATSLTNELFNKVDVKQIAEDALPPRAQFLASPLAAGVKDAVDRAAVAILSTDQFKNVWIDANRVAHEQIVKALTDKGTVIETANGKITLDLSALIGKVRQALDDRGITVFDKLAIQKLSLKFELMDSEQLKKAQTGAKLLNTLAWVLPVLALITLGWRSVAVVEPPAEPAALGYRRGGGCGRGRRVGDDRAVVLPRRGHVADVVAGDRGRGVRHPRALLAPRGPVDDRDRARRRHRRVGLRAVGRGRQGPGHEPIVDGQDRRCRQRARVELRPIRHVGGGAPRPAAGRIGVGGAPRARELGSPPGADRVLPRHRLVVAAGNHRDRRPGRLGRGGRFPTRPDTCTVVTTP